ncbi:RNA polymerase sigma factor [Reichenbachiella versicolor]|uniref:RNA polymerase sigma factor n=1 Tax=Reichenbachiella versicolor TaxID=1821036 RepID=UPI000D6E0DE1|nr:RNA polymerase sigma factor [Reichenbachiella versicolor]
MKPVEKKLIRDCIDGNRKSQEELYKLYAGKMFLVCMRYSKEQQEAEDILQESFIKIFKQLKSFKGESSLFFWMKRIVINTALNSQRSKLYLFPMVDVNEMKEETSQSSEPSDYSMEELMNMINKLPQSSRIIFNLYAVEGYKHHEIADMLKISIGTSKSQYARAKQLLREQMTDISHKYGQG